MTRVTSSTAPRAFVSFALPVTWYATVVSCFRLRSGVVVACLGIVAACQAVIDSNSRPNDGAGDGGSDGPGGDYCGKNDVAPAIGQLARPQVSVDRGFYDAPFQVVLTSDAAAEISYTLDGSVPSESNGKRGPSPVSLDITSTTTLRARALAPAMMASSVATYTYIFLDDVLAQPKAPAGYPLLKIGGEGDGLTLDYQMDPAIVKSSPDELRKGMKDVPTVSIVMNRDDMFGPEGIYDSGGSGMNSAWERAASVELIVPEKPSQQLQIDAAIRPHTHLLLKRSFKLLFKSAYGPGKMHSCLMQGTPVSGKGATREFDSLILRGGTNRSLSAACNPDDSTYLEDQWMHDAQIAMSEVGGRGTFVHLYLNGLYFGLYNAMERPDDGFLEAYFGGKKSDWFSINHGGVVDGDPARWTYLTTTLIRKDMTIAANYQELTQYLDVPHFIDYLILNWFSGRTDWPRNNWYAGNRNNPPGPVRFFIWDADEVWDGRCQGPGDPTPDIYGARVLPAFVVGSKDSLATTETARIWHAARRNREFMKLFVQRVDLHLGAGGALSDEANVARLDALSPFIEDAFLGETARWGDARAALGERKRTRENMWRPTLLRWRNQRIPGNGAKFMQSLRAEGFYP